jgi:hypothetical protein
VGGLFKRDELIRLSAKRMIIILQESGVILRICKYFWFIDFIGIPVIVSKRLD